MSPEHAPPGPRWGCSGRTSAVGLLGGRLVLAQAHSRRLDVGEVVRQGHVKDLVLQGVAVCGGTGTQHWFGPSSPVHLSLTA